MCEGLKLIVIRKATRDPDQSEESESDPFLPQKKRLGYVTLLGQS